MSSNSGSEAQSARSGIFPSSKAVSAQLDRLGAGEDERNLSTLSGALVRKRGEAKLTDDNRLDAALNLLAELEWDEGLTLIWEEIDLGSEQARLELGWLFDANGLHSFSMDQWLYLSNNSSNQDVKSAAKQNAASNRMWMRDYPGALALVSGNTSLESFREELEGRRDEDFFSDINAFATTVSELLNSEAQLLASLDSSFSRSMQLELCQVRDALASASSYLQHSGSHGHKAAPVELTNQGSVALSRTAAEALSESRLAWWSVADAASILIADYADDWGQALDEETFGHACRIGNTALAQVFLIQGDHAMSDDRKQATVQNIGAGLLNLGSFAGFIYSGLV